MVRAVKTMVSINHDFMLTYRSRKKATVFLEAEVLSNLVTGNPVTEDAIN